MDPYDGFDEFVVARRAALSRTAYLLTGDHHLAQDLLQVALSRVATHWRRLRDGAPDAYARRIMVNELTSWRRRRRYHERPVDVVDDEPDPGDLSQAVVRRVLVGRAMARLTPKQRAVLVLRFYEDLSEAATAEALGCSLGTVKSQTHQALARIRAVAPELADLVREPQEVRA
ncbi:SigE family RNA polymerase sigma factor [Luedemannella flava]|uniref:SigE family RNA polymerase sigma factor n=1 Tax=Luedemannella flava TaxID=349316 RepID=A0ABN2M9B9_9ACTN